MKKINFQDFKFPSGGEAEAFWEAQKALLEEDERFADYFRILIGKIQYKSESNNREKLNASEKPGGSFSYVNVFSSIFKFISKLSLKKKESEFDILFNATFYGIKRESEKDFLRDFIDAVYDSDLSLCVLFNNSEEASYFRDRSKKFFTLIATDCHRNKLLSQVLSKVSDLLSDKDFYRLNSCLGQNGLTIKTECENSVRALMKKRVEQYFIWNLISKKITYRAAVLRCIRDHYSYAISHTSKKNGLLSIGFQHGVVGHTLEIPIIVDRYLTVGTQSMKVIQNLNREFAPIIGESKLCSDFRSIGSITDDIAETKNNFSKKTILIIDQTVTSWNSAEFYGTSSQAKSIERLIKSILDHSEARRVIVRPHPDADFIPLWRAYLSCYLERFEVSHPQLTLKEDIDRSSIAIGIFSGGLMSCASSGLPTYFLSSHGGYFTPDIGCFEDDFVSSEEKILSEVKTLLSDESYYLLQQAEILRRGKQYCHNNRCPTIEPEFINKFILDM